MWPLQVLRIHLKRFRWSGARREKIQAHVQFPQMLSMEMFSEPQAASRAFEDAGFKRPAVGSFIYDLQGVVVHEGRGINSGHYTAFCHNQKDNVGAVVSRATAFPAAKS